MTCLCLWISAVMVNEQICIRFPNEKHHITLLENRLIFGKFTQYTMLVYILCFMLPKKKKKQNEKLTRNSCLFMQNRSTMQEQKLKQISIHTLYYISVSVKCPGTVKIHNLKSE